MRVDNVMDENKIDQKLEKIEDSIQEIKITLVRNTDSLEYHIRRTDLLEKNLEPVQTHVKHVEGVIKFIGIIALIAGIGASIMKILNP
jgi:hypothetical protein